MCFSIPLTIWEDWATFWARCQELIVAIAKIYHPEVKYPLLNIYVTQAYGLIRGTTDDMDLLTTWSPLLVIMAVSSPLIIFSTIDICNNKNIVVLQ